MTSGRDVERAISTVVFDLGGVLIDWDPRHLYRRRFADDGDMEAFLSEVCNPAWHRQHDEGRLMRETIPELVREHPEMADQISAWDRQGEMIAGAFDANVAIVGELRARGVRLLALTNWCQESFPSLRDRFPFIAWFEGIVVSSVEGVAKPEPAIFEVLIRRFHLVPSGTLFIDDSSEHVATAERLGFSTHRFRSPAALRSALVDLDLLD